VKKIALLFLILFWYAFLFWVIPFFIGGAMFVNATIVMHIVALVFSPLANLFRRFYD
jgi:hypothetical protein